jgi:hypothetical protein
MRKDVALSIVNAAKEGGYQKDPVPERDDEVIELGEYWLAEATRMLDGPMKNNATVQAIVALGNGDAPAPVAEEPGEPASPPPAEDPPLQEEKAGTPGSSAVDEANALIMRENLPVPPEMEGDPPDMPGDLTQVDDRQIRRLHGQFNAYLARTMYVISQESLRLNESEILHRRVSERARLRIEKMDPVTNRAKLADDIMAEVNADKEVREWADRVEQHKANRDALKALADIYGRHLSVLSRESSMREFEWTQGQRR